MLGMHCSAVQSLGFSCFHNPYALLPSLRFFLVECSKRAFARGYHARVRAHMRTFLHAHTSEHKPFHTCACEVVRTRSARTREAAQILPVTQAPAPRQSFYAQGRIALWRSGRLGLMGCGTRCRCCHVQPERHRPRQGMAMTVPGRN